MMPLQATFPLKNEPRPAIATGMYHVTAENLPLTLKLPLESLKSESRWEEVEFSQTAGYDRKISDRKIIRRKR